MRLAHVLFALASVIGLSTVALFGRQLAMPDIPPAPSVAAAPLEKAGLPPLRVETPDARPVASTNFVPAEPDALQRVEPRAPLGELSLALPPRPKAPDWKGLLLARPVAASAGIVDAMGYHLTVADIDALDIRDTCGEGAGEWPCGLKARTAFRGWLRGRSLECDLPPKTPPGIVTAHCKLGRQDAGAWLVANGWARPDGGHYVDEAAKAKGAKVGMWGEGGSRE